ncbi:MAG TPA: ATP-binding protein [Nitrososphaerales archaeon]|nr:ATP-binding protein [Nitrososphaerales archaeon]
MQIAIILISSFLVVSSIIGITSVMGIRTSNANIVQIAEHEIPKVRAVSEMQMYAKEAAKNVADYNGLNIQEAKTDFRKNAEGFKTLSTVYRDLSQNEAERAVFSKMDKVFSDFEKSGYELISIQDTQNSKIDDAINLIDEKIKVALDDLKKNLNPSNPDFIKKQEALQRMEISLSELMSSVRGYTIHPDELLITRIDDSTENFVRYQREFLGLQVTHDETIRMAQLNKQFESLQSLTQEIIVLEDKQPSLVSQFGGYDERLEKILDDELEPMVISRINQVEDKVLNTASTTFMAFIASVVLATALGIAISRSISKPIAKMRDAANQIAKGNLDVQLKVGGTGEISSLSKSFNTMIDKIKAQDKAQKEFISVASHEIRSPIQPILSYADLAKKGHISQDEAWTSVLAQARRLQHLSNDILYVTRIEGGDLTYTIRRVKVNEIVNEVINIEKVNLRGTTTLDINLDKDIEIEADKDRITQVLTNVIGNAVKFTKDGKIRVETHILPGKNKVEIKVSDTAGGIPKEIIPKLFGKFVTKNVGAEVQHGTGLGLFISKAIVTAHKGEISGYNNEEGGASFTIILPIRQ